MEVYIKIMDGQVAYVSIAPIDGASLYAVDLYEEEKEEFARWAGEDEIILHVKEHQGKPVIFDHWVSETSTLFVDTWGDYHMAFGRDLRWSKYTNAQEAFAAWAKGKRLAWIDYADGPGAPGEFSHWVSRTEFSSTDNIIWDACDHGFPESDHGYYKEII